MMIFIFNFITSAEFAVSKMLPLQSHDATYLHSFRMTTCDNK